MTPTLRSAKARRFNARMMPIPANPSSSIVQVAHQ
jgi:hypothetical protein